MEIKTFKIDNKKLLAYRRLQIEAAKRGLDVDPETMKLTTKKPTRNQWWLEGDQYTPDLYKEESDG